jgi:hypothetical protein
MNLSFKSVPSNALRPRKRFFYTDNVLQIEHSFRL